MRPIRLIRLIGPILLLFLAFFLLRSKPDSQTPAALQLNQANTIANSEINTTDKTTEVKVKNKDYQISFSAEKSDQTRYSRLANGIKEEIILAKAPATPFIAKYTATLSGVKPRFFKDLWRFFNEEGKEQFFIPKPFMVDQKGQKSESINLQISPISANQYQITLTPDHSWLISPDRTYPVVIDPSIEVPEQPIQEILDKRNQTSKTYSLPNNSFAWEGSIGPIHYKDNPNNPEESWKEIDTRVQPATDLSSGYGFQNLTNNFKSFFKRNSKDPGTVKYENNSNYITFTNQDNELGQLRSVEGYAQDNQFVYPEAYDNIDIKYSIGTSVLLEEFVLKKPRDVSKISQRVRFSDAEYRKQKDGSINFYSTKTNELIWTFPKPKMYELNARKDENGLPSRFENFGLHYEISKDGDDYIVTKVIDQEGKDWLNSSEREYPLVIDTTLDLQVGASADDAEHYTGTDQSGPWLHTNSTGTGFRRGSLGSYNSGQRFTGITISSGSTVTASYITFTAQETYNPSGYLTGRIQGELSANPDTFSTLVNYTGRTRTTNYADWVDPSITLDVEYDSPSLNAVIQELLDAYIYSNTPIVIFATVQSYSGTTKDMYAYSYDASTTKAPKLHIEYSPSTSNIKFNGLKMQGIQIK